MGLATAFEDDAEGDVAGLGLRERLAPAADVSCVSEPPQPLAASSGRGANALSTVRRDQTTAERGASGAVTLRPYVTDSLFSGGPHSGE